MFPHYFILRSKELLAGLFLLFASGCTIKEISEEPEFSRYSVRILFSPNGLGDLAYNDAILKGILQEKKENAFRLYYICPENMVQAENMIGRWQKEDDRLHYYNIMGGGEFEKIARNIRPAEKKTNWLMFETLDRDMNIATFRYGGYGVSFLAGLASCRYARGDTAAFIGGQRGESFIEECYVGFRDGFLHAGGKAAIACYLSEETDGFAMADKAYVLADSLYKKYTFLYVIAGGSNNGVYQYLREHPEVDGYTNGVDMDQSGYSDRIIGSVVKNIGECIGGYIRRWMQGQPLTEHKEYNLPSGKIAFRIAERYKASLERLIRDSFEVAVRKESKYYDGKKD